MALKLINATEAKLGTSIIIEGAPCIIRKMDVSKTGKHGHAKVRLEAIGIIDDKKRVLVVPGHERFEVPLIEKKRGQVLSKLGQNISLMDVESYETIDVACPEEIKNEIKEGDNVEYWIVEGEKIVKKKS